MVDALSIIDSARSKIPSNAKLLVAWVVEGTIIHAAQANMTQADIRQVADSLLQSALPQTQDILRSG